MVSILDAHALLPAKEGTTVIIIGPILMSAYTLSRIHAPKAASVTAQNPHAR